MGGGREVRQDVSQFSRRFTIVIRYWLVWVQQHKRIPFDVKGSLAPHTLIQVKVTERQGKARVLVSIDKCGSGNTGYFSSVLDVRNYCTVHHVRCRKEGKGRALAESHFFRSKLDQHRRVEFFNYSTMQCDVFFCSD